MLKVSLCFFLALTPLCGARAQTYPPEIAKAAPAALAAWRAITPRAYRREPWIARLDGVSTPLERVTMHGKPFYYGAVCIPHDCGGNFVSFLIALDGSDAYGLLASQTLGVRHRWFGAPDAEARGLLQRKING
ncbi:inhibitor of vertebrate lysozyme family protein [Rhodoblastus acidophilus]|uniref:Inhibitor of vertebrate lysozyme family protein n=1 Tax=Candidatus Rhodoblastus alkanivorans TaxID=2954117 RepID=A0ABS9ZB42_9HYPH|nr:Ivy family c-type lysozyme inhibitor [Candidatus Rhodoblastus alkanivorans]MCI4680044.1 inhibitor of vertebrate lysozyme family protein [Candidatus Rhodoblastus alkanivorans]MCI4684792.1 inhibitor of vertebrate lysozyme family protein [Candidatus Rhodoblastus alkanivorans]MDI4642116.1 inhibitor of vertebrate lysozyme family protein [Rhodoblastus acidophilus]